MSQRYKFLDERKFRSLCEGLSFDAKDMAVLDSALCGLDEKLKLPSRIVDSNARHGYTAVFTWSGPAIIVSMTKLGKREGGEPMSLTQVVQDASQQHVPPSLHLELYSPVVQIPQRIEIPLRLVLKGLPDIEQTHSVYLHMLRMESGDAYVYYGITKRGWMKRFDEHTKAALSGTSPFLFHRIYRASVDAKLRVLYPQLALEDDRSVEGLRIASTHHVICVAGLGLEAAQDVEEYLVAKYSFAHPLGLNMIPGGRAGIAYLHQLAALSPAVRVVNEEERDRALGTYLLAHPRLGLPNPAIAQCWEDPDYAARIICGREDRLSVAQLNEIRRLGASGTLPARIFELVGANSQSQVDRVLKGKTYRRVPGVSAGPESLARLPLLA
jgi:hypothetical protein